MDPVTAAPDIPPRAFAGVTEAISSLRDSGLRISAPRRGVLEALFEAAGPVSAAHLARILTLEESSVYRNLELFEQRGVVRHLHLGHSPGLYALVRDPEVEYLYCERCTRVSAVSPARLDPVREHIRREFGHRPRFTHFAIVGVCEDCTGVGVAPANGPAQSEQRLHSHGAYAHAHAIDGNHAH